MSRSARILSGLALLLLGPAGCASSAIPRGASPPLAPGSLLGSSPAAPALIPATGPCPVPLPAVPPPPAAGEPPAFDLLLAAARALGRLRSLDGHLEQEVLLDGERIALGVRFSFQRPDQLRYELFAPVTQLLLSDGTTLWLRPPVDPAVGPPGEAMPAAAPAWIARPLADLSVQERSALGLVPGAGFDPLGPLPADAYEVAYLTRTGDHVQLWLRPRPGSPPPLPSLVVGLQTASAAVEHLCYYADAAGQRLAGFSAYREHHPALPGLVYPRRQLTRWDAGGRVLQVDTRLRGLRFNPHLPDALFAPPAASRDRAD
ncbi:MAG: hypothetical protein RBU45_13490 [Myxococcota bacterium]|nr:hypothetical protein [Myxococcota bacterium]